MKQSIEQESSPVIARAQQLLRTPFACSESEKLQMLVSLGQVDSPEAITCITEMLNLIEIPVNGSSNSRAEVPHGGAVSVQAAKMLAEINTPETNRILLEASGTISHHPLLRASILYGVKEAGSSLLTDCLNLGLVDPDWTVKKAALQIVDDTLKGSLNESQKEVAHTLLESYLYHHAPIETHNELLVQGGLTIFERIKERIPLNSWLREAAAPEELAPHVGLRIALLLPFIDNDSTDIIVTALLQRTDQLPEMYDYISTEVYKRRFPTDDVEAVCLEIKSGQGWMAVFKSVFQRVPAEIIEARSRAAEKMLSDA